jgi:alpha-tubulin suppressor-like RCC1 family protein
MRTLCRPTFAHRLLFWIFLAISLVCTQAWAVMPMVSAGWSHTCALTGDGAVRCWGANGGRLGDGTTIDSSTPVTVEGISTAISVSAGGAHTCALLSVGTVMCWGNNVYGKLGNGTLVNSSTPVAVNGVSNAISISVGGAHTCAVLRTGAIVCWGRNQFGQLGNSNTTSDSSSPVAVAGISSATSVSAGKDHTCAVLVGGAVLCWGRNPSGQLDSGVNLAGRFFNPVKPTHITNATSVSAGWYHTCAVVGSGGVQCWEDGAYGQLVFGGVHPNLRDLGISTATAVSASSLYACAVLAGGTVQCWSHGVNLQPVPGSTYMLTASPNDVVGVTRATAVTAGQGHACALLDSGDLQCWGRNEFGQTGNGTTSAENWTPTVVSGLNVSQIKLAWIDSTGVGAVLLPASAEIGQSFPIYVGAVLGSNLYLRGNAPTDWAQHQNGPLPVAQQVDTMPSTLAIDVVRGDISQFAGMDIYVGYGNMGAVGHLSKLLTVQKRTTVYFPRSGSPVSMASLSPFGGVIATRRDVDTSLGILDIIEPDGTYYQLVTKFDALHHMTIGGYTVSVLATDANGMVSEVAVRDPYGAVTSLTKPVAAAALPSMPARAALATSSCSNFADPERQLVCQIVMGHGHPTFELLRAAYDIVINAYDVQVRRRERVVAAAVERWGALVANLTHARDTLTRTETEVSQLGAELVAQRIGSSNNLVFTYPDLPTLEAPNVNGSNEAASRQIAADVKMLANGQHDLGSMVASRVGLVYGTHVVPAFCENYTVPRNGVCDPVITSVSPSVATLNRPTTFVAIGTDLTNGLKVRLQGCTNYTSAGSTGSSTQQQFTCTPTQVGQMTGYWNDATTGRLIQQFGVTVTAPVVLTGQVSMWTNQDRAVSVSIDNQYVGSLNSSFVSIPSCGASGTLTLTLPAGNHVFSASSSVATWPPANFQVIANQCIMVSFPGSNTGSGGHSLAGRTMHGTSPNGSRFADWTFYAGGSGIYSKPQTGSPARTNAPFNWSYNDGTGRFIISNSFGTDTAGSIITLIWTSETSGYAYEAGYGTLFFFTLD